MNISTTIDAGSGTIHVAGKRSVHGWDVLLAAKGSGDLSRLQFSLQAHFKHKEDAIQAARDACEPGLPVALLVRPSAPSSPKPGKPATHIVLDAESPRPTAKCRKCGALEAFVQNVTIGEILSFARGFLSAHQQCASKKARRNKALK